MSNRPFEVTIDLPVRTYDIDFAGVVSNIVYVRWLEDLRLEMLACHFPLGEQLKNGIVPVIVQTKIDYKQPLRLSDQPIGKMWMSTLESLRWNVCAEITSNDKTCAMGEQVGIFVNLQSQKPIRIPEVLQQQYRKLAN